MDQINDNNKEIKDKIKKELVDPSYFRDVKYNLDSRFRWKFIGDLSEGISQLLILSCTMLAFSSGFFDIRALSYVSGALGIGSLSLLRFSSYAMSESRERTWQSNVILKQLGIESVPDIVVDSTNDKNNNTDINIVCDI